MTERRKRLYVQTFGCQMNVYDADQMVTGLAPMGYERARSAHEADLILVVTCAIREKADQKVFSYLGRLEALKARRPGLKIAVGGCVAQGRGRRILSRAPHVDAVFGTHAVGRLPAIIRRIEAGGGPVVDVTMDGDGDAFAPFTDPPADPGVARFVTIMQGCDNYCTYCVVPYVRGPETSRPPESVVAEVTGLVRAGVREVTLLGQNVNSYGVKEGLPGFPDLLGRVAGVRGLKRIRFTTSHPKDLSDGLIESYRQIETLCPHIHLPVQSGSDRVLKRMNRKYDRKRYLERVARLREARPGIAVTTDIIVGFPGETDADFQLTLDFLDAVRFDSLFAFKYSDRPQAPAARFSDPVPEPIKAERLNTLLAAQTAITGESYARLVGTEADVLVEGPARRNGAAAGTQWTGRTPENRIVNFTAAPPASPIAPGMTVRVAIAEALAHSLRGTAIPLDAPADARKGEHTHAA